MSATDHALPPSRPIAPSPRPYDRSSELPRILPLWPSQLANDSPRGRRLILARLRRALRVERRRGIAGHWTYDLGRHVELLRVYRLELARCDALRKVPHPTEDWAPETRSARSARGQSPPAPTSEARGMAEYEGPVPTQWRH